jgi:hypothetical protein
LVAGLHFDYPLNGLILTSKEKEEEYEEAKEDNKKVDVKSVTAQTGNA